ncbi:hypothetical protein NQD34_002960 [Periophthalmus magnuspinnatus]|nr:hypothetical protein NQD34_002960 [Periophthalmus magnuspinnatus]
MCNFIQFNLFLCGLFSRATPGCAVTSGRCDVTALCVMAAEARVEEGDIKPDAEGETEESASDDNKPSTTTERHISIQSRIEDLEALVDLNGAGRKACPLCPEEKFKSCYSHKLRRHLQNLHWKVYVEFQGQRMCICHLPCRTLKPSPSSEQACSSRAVAHYHYVVCSGTIARKTDMIGHLKRHTNKGETRASYSLDPDQDQDRSQEPAPSGHTLEILKELGTNVQLMPNHNTPQKSDTYFSRKMKTNRQLVFCSLAALAEERSPLECLDAFGATGIMGLQWAKHLRSAVRVTITDISDTCVNMIRENCQLNQIRVAPWAGPESGSESGSGPGPGSGAAEGRYLTTVEVNKMDANVIMHLRPFYYMSGPLFHSFFLRTMLKAAVRHSMEDVQPLIKTLLCESDCTTLKYPALTNQVECGVVIKTLQSPDESGADSSGETVESPGPVLL